jgi:hypothetical protein
VAESTKDRRRKIISLGRDYLDRRITWQYFMDQTSELRGDKLIDELVDLIEHEPKKGGLIGVSEREWQEYQDRVRYVIGLLEQ